MGATAAGYVDNFAWGTVAVDAGQILALLGPNGAGKTSTILALMGHVPIKSGALRVGGVDVTRASALERVELGLALVPDFRGKSMRDVIEESSATGIQVTIEGSGVARAQVPLPGTPLHSGEQIRIVFTR